MLKKITKISSFALLCSLLLVTSIFADSDSLESESAPFDSMNLEHQELMAISRELAALAPAATTDTDYTQYIYNLLIACMSTSDNASSTYVLPRISSYLSTIMSRVNTTNTRLNTINNNLVAWFDSGTNSYNIYELLLSLCEEMGVLTNTGPNLLTQLGNIASRLTDIYNADYSSLIYSDVVDIVSNTDNINTSLTSLNSNVINLENLNFLRSGSLNYVSYAGGSQLPSNTSINQTTYFTYTFNSIVPSFGRFYVPIYQYSQYYSKSYIKNIDFFFLESSGSLTKFKQQPKYYIVQSGYGLYIYTPDFVNVVGTGSVVLRFEFTSGVSYTFRGNSFGFSDSLSFDSIDYQLLKIAFSQDAQTDALSKLQKVLASDKKLAAEEASQEVIDDTLDGFTGSGSAAPSKSDTGSMKSISGDLKSGLNGGGSVSNATSVFSSNGGFWDWFTQSNYNNINNIPSNTRNIKKSKSNSNDEIIDFYSLNAEELQLLLEGE